MGSCCASHVKYGAFRHDLGTPLIDDIKPKLTAESKVVIVRLSALRDIPIGNAYAGSTDAFVELRLLPKDPIAGDQKQLSSVRPGSLSPKWEPPERFQFVVSRINDAKVIMSIYHYNPTNEKDSQALGDAQIKLKDFQPGLLSSIPGTPTSTSSTSSGVVQSSSSEITKVVKIVNTANGKPAGEVEVIVSILTLEEACNVQDHTCYEFQRWSPVNNWGNLDPPHHLLLTDPGRWCSEDGKKFGADLEHVAPPVPPGWEVTKSWRTFGTDHDPEGWQYAPTFESPYWYSQNSNSSLSSYVVRRRTWHREVKNTGAIAKAVELSKGGDKTSGRRRRMFSQEKKK